MKNSASAWPVNRIKPYTDYLRVEAGLSENTLLAYQRDLAKFTEFCHDKGISKPDQLSPLLLQQFAQYLASLKLATPSIARHLTAVKMFLRFHLLNSWVKKDVCAALESPKLWRRLPGVLSKQKTVELITAGDPENELYPRDRALLELLYATGLRASEAANLTLKDINFQIGYIRCIGKGRKERIVPIHQTALDAINDYLRDLRPKLLGSRTTGQLFLSRTGQALSRIEVWRIVRRSAIAAGMPGKITPHTLRHCFGSHLLQGGADLRIVQELLGHADVTTTQIYTHVDQEHLRAIHKKYHPRG
ncbi:MAG: tyrosine recombinase XerD [Sedimentisphaerales bacterium]|nr:tyrosine recombinase XerD [Sedimentisphaerales bacterium]